MNNSKNHNPILFLTTLGVYLGLVLAGGVSPALAHAAMTRNFELKDEIEVKDDLDNKPDDQIKELLGSIEEYFKEVGTFVDDLRKLHQIEKFDPEYNTFNTEQIAYSPCPETGGQITEGPSETLDRWLAPAITEAKYRHENWTWLAECLPSNKFSQADRTEAKTTGFKVSLDKSELLYQIYVTRSSTPDAQLLLEDFQKAFKLYDAADESKIVKILHKHTSFSSSDNQVFIITRLPRAGLDPLLAKDAK